MLESHILNFWNCATQLLLRLGRMVLPFFRLSTLSYPLNSCCRSAFVRNAVFLILGTIRGSAACVTTTMTIFLTSCGASHHCQIMFSFGAFPKLLRALFGYFLNH